MLQKIAGSQSPALRVERHTLSKDSQPLPSAVQPWRIKAEHLLFLDLIERSVDGQSKARFSAAVHNRSVSSHEFAAALGAVATCARSSVGLQDAIAVSACDSAPGSVVSGGVLF